MNSLANDDVVRIDSAQLAHLQQWVGKTETRHDTVTAASVQALANTLDRDDPPAQAGTLLPPLWHWLQFLPQHRQSEIGPDGHPHRGGFLPPVSLPRRMWAGGRLQWQTANPLRVGDVVRRDSRIQSVTHKPGRTGDLVFVVVRHDIFNAAGLAVSEEQDIVYRAMAQPGEAPVAGALAPQEAAWSRELTPDPVWLFRYSALTFNGHRIHYDRGYATDVEGYPGLVVHGPLIATLLMDLLRRQHADARVASFQFKAMRPTFDLHPFRVSGQALAPNEPCHGASVGIQLWAQDHEGLLTMQANATLS